MVAEHKSPDVPEALDPRAAKTRSSISSAFVLLLGRRSYARIRVSDITKKAGVGRATFYAHFASKDALLGAEMTRIVQHLLIPLAGDASGVDATALFAHIEHAQGAYRALMADDSRPIAERIVKAAIERRIEMIHGPHVEQAMSTTWPSQFVPRFLAATLLELLGWSLLQPDFPRPATLQGWYRSLVGGAVGRDAWTSADSSVPELRDRIASRHG